MSLLNKYFLILRKSLLYFIILFILTGCINELKNENFIIIKKFILNNGDRVTYCNKYNHNPHYRFDGFDVYLNPDIGQKNINCDPELSDFDEMVIQDWNTGEIYFHIKLFSNKIILDKKDQKKTNEYFKIMLKKIKAMTKY